MRTWALQDAKARFSELVKRALMEGPQEVTRHGHPAVVVVPALDYFRLSQRRETLSQFFASAPRIELNIVRDQGGERQVDL